AGPVNKDPIGRAGPTVFVTPGGIDAGVTGEAAPTAVEANGFATPVRSAPTNGASLACHASPTVKNGRVRRGSAGMAIGSPQDRRRRLGRLRLVQEFGGPRRVARRTPGDSRCGGGGEPPLGHELLQRQLGQLVNKRGLLAGQ